jgi:hypothetical protein
MDGGSGSIVVEELRGIALVRVRVPDRSHAVAFTDFGCTITAPPPPPHPPSLPTIPRALPLPFPLSFDVFFAVQAGAPPPPSSQAAGPKRLSPFLL